MNAGVYLHIPFCRQKCGYCSFFSVPATQREIDAYVDTLHKEIDYYHSRFKLQPDTLYFGGGTPSLLAAAQIRSLIDRFALPPNAEITLEVNPQQLTGEWLEQMATTRVNRLSIGVQSTLEQNLQWLGRKHKASDLHAQMKLCRSYGFNNLSVDFIYGLPNETVEMVRDDLLALLVLRPRHISTYLLSLQEGVPLYSQKEQLPSDTLVAEQYAMIRKILGKKGYKQYELSSFTRQGCRSRHNLHYWEDDVYFGFGAGAAGSLQTHRWQNPADLALWRNLVEKEDLLSLHIPQTLQEQKANLIIMQLRLMRGVRFIDFYKRFGNSIKQDFFKEMEKCNQAGLLTYTQKGMRLTPRAFFISNVVMREFV